MWILEHLAQRRTQQLRTHRKTHAGAHTHLLIPVRAAGPATAAAAGAGAPRDPRGQGRGPPVGVVTRGAPATCQQPRAEKDEKRGTRREGREDRGILRVRRGEEITLCRRSFHAIPCHSMPRQASRRPSYYSTTFLRSFSRSEPRQSQEKQAGRRVRAGARLQPSTSTSTGWREREREHAEDSRWFQAQRYLSLRQPIHLSGLLQDRTRALSRRKHLSRRNATSGGAPT